MTYNPDKPDRGPSPDIDVAQIQTNFAQWASVFSQNHTAMNNRNQGDHEKVQMNLQANDPGVTNDLTALYAKDALSQAGTEPQLFAQIPQFLPTDNDLFPNLNTGMQLTYNSVNTAGPQYQSFLPGGYLLYFGATTNIATVITLSPAPTKILVAIAAPNSFPGPSNLPDIKVSTNILTNSTFKINSTITGVYSVSWVAIAQA